MCHDNYNNRYCNHWPLVSELIALHEHAHPGLSTLRYCIVFYSDLPTGATEMLQRRRARRSHGLPAGVGLRLSRQPLRSAWKCVARVVAPTDFRKTVLEVAVGLTPEDEAELRFAVKDSVPSESVVQGRRPLSGLGLIECLERHGLLESNNCTFLIKCLKDMGRRDLADLLAPPEDVQAAPRPATLSSSSSLALVPAASSAQFRWSVSSFRKVVLDVSRELNEEEVEKICWLSKDFFHQDIPRTEDHELRGVELLNAMEDSHLLGPGNYSFLIDCLQQIGRLDLVSVIEPPTLPYLPPSLSILAQLHQKRMDALRLKKTQYSFGMRSLVLTREKASDLIPQNAVGWFRRICGSLSPHAVEAHSSYIIENLPTTLINTSLYANSLMDAIEEYHYNGDTCVFAGDIADSEKHLENLQSLMEKVGWDIYPRKKETLATSRQYHPVRQVSYGAFSGLVEFTVELSNSRERVQEETRRLSSALMRLESVLRLAGYMWSVTSWLIALLQVAVRSPICLDKHKGLFRILLTRNKTLIFNNSSMVEDVLGRSQVGCKLLDKLRKKNIISPIYANNQDNFNSTLFLFHTCIIPMPVFAFMIILLSECPSMAPEDLEKIVLSLKQYIEGKTEAFCQIYGVVTMMVLDGIFQNVESFRQSRMHELDPNCTRNEIFSY